MRRTLIAVIALSLSFAGCKLKEMADKASIQKDLDKRGTLDLMKEVANDKYDPPKDGKLTDAQVQMYLKVRNHQRDISKVAQQNFEAKAKEADAQKNTLSGMFKGMQAMSSAADMATADLRAAKDLHVNTQEYLWVKGQIMTASMTAFTEKISDAMQAQVDSAHSQMRKAYDEAKDEQSKAAAKQALDQIEKTASEGHATAAQAQADPAVEYNRQLLKKYDNELSALTNDKTQADDLTKKLDQAVQDAKKQQ